MGKRRIGVFLNGKSVVTLPKYGSIHRLLFWGRLYNGNTLALQARNRGSIPRGSTKFVVSVGESPRSIHEVQKGLWVKCLSHKEPSSKWWRLVVKNYSPSLPVSNNRAWSCSAIGRRHKSQKLGSVGSNPTGTTNLRTA